jgi:hypothetical protein
LGWPKLAATLLQNLQHREVAMALYGQLLKAEEVVKLQEILLLLQADKTVGGLIRNEFRSYVDHVSGLKISKFDLTRVLRRPTTAPYHRQVLVYDYVYDRLAPSIVNGRLHGIPNDTIQLVKAFLRDGKWRSKRPWGIEGLEDFSLPVPASFINQYFGYRMSANAGTVIRFYLDIHKTADDREISYRNLYRRGNMALEIKGTGRYVFDALYLVGHAMDVRGTGSQGMRLMALKPIGTSRNLTGIVITSDRSFPIAARVLLIPVAQHVLNSPSKAGPSTKEINKLVTKNMNDQTVVDAIADVQSHALDEIKVRPTNTPEETFAMFIENTTPTVLKAGDELTFDLERLSKQINLLRERVQYPGGKEMAMHVANAMSSAFEAYRVNLEAGFARALLS